MATGVAAKPDAKAGFLPDEETIVGVPEGYIPLALARLVDEAQAVRDAPTTILHITVDDRRLEQLETGLAFFAPKTKVISVPAWDTVPYDRASPDSEIVARRIAALTRIAAIPAKGARIVLTTANAVLQRTVPREFLRKGLRQLAPGQRSDRARLVERLQRLGYTRVGTVMEPGEFAVRGSLLDIYPPGRGAPVRLDFFGDTIEVIKAFDPETQRTGKIVQKLTLMPVSEVAFGRDAESRFRQGYLAQFGGSLGEDPLYEAVSAGQRYPGMEHWLALFHDRLETLFDYLPEAIVSLDPFATDSIKERLEQIADHYSARLEARESDAFGAPPYKPLPPEQMFLTADEWRLTLAARYRLSFSETGTSALASSRVRDMGGRPGRIFAAERHSAAGPSVFEAVAAHVKSLQAQGRRVLIAAWTNGAGERMATMLAEHGLERPTRVADYSEAIAKPQSLPLLATLGLERGFETRDLVVIAENDVLGDRLVRPKKRQRKAADVITEATSLSVGDLVVHADHGIGRFVGLKTITALGAAYDCLEIDYAGGDKFYLPVHNIELLTRYGSDETGAQLDRLGSVAWQTRKARLKKRLREIAAELIKIAALRQLKSAPVLERPEVSYDEFVARFPYQETEDQAQSIDAVLADLASGRPMDRLVCGDVGFGKTEVALRAAFVTAMAGLQVAVVVPTTLLARQHFKVFTERFQGLPVKIVRASRLVPAKELAETRARLKDGTADIVIGTHALLAKNIAFKRLGLVVVDEEQHFGVQHKERLKQLKEDVHVLTLTATPIPRTLQMALAGLRELSLITTPPIDRLAVRTFISPVDPVILRDALRRERNRGGQSFYVVPRIADLDDVGSFLAEEVPELRVARAHGQMSPTELEAVMSAFYDGQYDILLSTAIVESGLDIPNANTLIVHRADMFGLAQLYQLRGRVGRSKTRAYAYLTLPPGKRLTEGAEKRLKVLHSLDTLGAGFSLASHDLDIRGAGNLLGEEQSGHIREVGFELYQAMFEEAVAAMKGGEIEVGDDQWSPQITLNTVSLLPEAYVPDLQARLGLYRRLATLTSRAEIDSFAEELIDRFGPLPPEVEHLLDVVEIKALCRRAGIAEINAGPKGAAIVFRKGQFANTQGLVAFIQASKGMLRLQPDQKLVFKADWESAAQRIKGVRILVEELARIAAGG